MLFSYCRVFANEVRINDLWLYLEAQLIHFGDFPQTFFSLFCVRFFHFLRAARQKLKKSFLHLNQTLETFYFQTDRNQILQKILSCNIPPCILTGAEISQAPVPS